MRVGPAVQVLARLFSLKRASIYTSKDTLYTLHTRTPESFIEDIFSLALVPSPERYAELSCHVCELPNRNRRVLPAINKILHLSYLSYDIQVWEINERFINYL